MDGLYKDLGAGVGLGKEDEVSGPMIAIRWQLTLGSSQDVFHGQWTTHMACKIMPVHLL